MPNWNYSPENSIILPIAADARLSSTDYIDDQIWELNIGNSEPAAISLQTTFGLRARNCRIFPRFINDGQVMIDPAKFYRPITIHTFYPNFISLSFKPFSSINVNIEFWVPGSHMICARSKITNTSHESHQFQLEWAELLIPSPDGRRMAIDAIGFITILAGHTANLSPVLYLTGGVKAGNSPYPSLNVSFELPPHGEQESRWVSASLEETQSSFEQAREVLNRNWEAEFARIHRVNSMELEIITGNHDWNTALYLSQVYSRQLILHSTDACRAPSFVYSRNPDQGFSLSKDGSDYNHLWNGQTTFDAYYLSNFLLPSSPDLLRGILDNFFASQTEQGEIDWKPGLGGQRSQLLTTPLLGSLSWMYYRYSGHTAYVRTIFTKLLKYYYSWFTHAHDRDDDLVPEWDQAIQTGFEEHPLFSHVHVWSVGVDISTVESPDLIAYLYRDGLAIMSIARLIGEDDTLHQLEQLTCQLKTMLDQAWSDASACYLYRDRDSHISNQGEILAVQYGSGVMEIQREFQQPIRPMLSIKSKSERTQPVQVYIHGVTPLGAHRVDHIPSQRIRWHLGSGFVTSEFVYQAIERIEITGVTADVPVTIRSVGLTGLDLTLLLPLWAGIPSEEKAKILANLTLLNKKKFLSPFGLRPSIDDQDEAQLPDDRFAMPLPLISLILEGLVRYSMQHKAADVFSRWMKALINSQKLGRFFPRSFHSEIGAPAGGNNTLASLVPIGLFLKILGVNIVSPSEVEVTHANPFPWPVTLKYRGLTVVQQEKKAMVIFPGGQSVTIDNDQSQIVRNVGA